MQRTISLLGAIAFSSVLATPFVANAFGRREISCDSAERGFTVKVAQGIGVDLLLNCGGPIIDVQVSDPSQVVVRRKGPQSIYVKMISPLQFQGNLHSLDGTTMLSVLTGDNKNYQFLLKPYRGISDYSLLDIKPNTSSVAARPKRHFTPIQAESPIAVTTPPTISMVSDIPKPPPTVIDLRGNSSPVPAEVSSQPRLTLVPPSVSPEPKLISKIVEANPKIFAPKKTISSFSGQPLPKPKQVVKVITSSLPTTGHAQANALVRGLIVAKNKKQIGYQSAMWRKVNDLVYLLRIGKTLDSATIQANVPTKTVTQLLSWGTK